MNVTVRPERKPLRRAREHRRRTFTAAIRVDGNRVVITPARGCHVRRTDADGEVIGDSFEPQTSLFLNIGDRVIVCGPSIEEIAAVTVLAVSRDAVSVYARISHGTFAETTTRVHLLPVKMPTAKQLGLFKAKPRRAS